MEKILLYCTKSKPYLHYDEVDEAFVEYIDYGASKLNGKIVAECECDLVEWIGKVGNYYKTDSLTPQQLLEYSCLNHDDLNKYICDLDKRAYALHLKNVKVFDKPKELDNYFKDNFLQELSDKDTRIHRAPQNMCYVYDKDGNEYILISIRPEHLANILNGFKTVEIRRKILNSLKELIR